MKARLPLPVNTRAFAALLRRELRSALINRYFQVFCGLSLLGGIAAFVFSEDSSASAFFILQIALYLVSLFAVLGGVSSAQAEREEWPLLLTQPAPRHTFVLGKFVALFAIFGAVLLLLFAPSLFSGANVRTLGQLFGETLLLAAAFTALGLAAGYLAHDRAQGLILAVSAWLIALVGVDLVALFGARWAILQSMPDLWLVALMLNPLDAFRVETLFALQKVPAEAADKTPLAAWWIAHAGVWFSTIATLWCGALIAFATHRLNRWEE